MKSYPDTKNYNNLPLHIRLVAKAAKQLKLKYKIYNTAGCYYVGIEKKSMVKIFGIPPLPLYPLNNAASQRLSKDKILTYQLMQKNKINCPRGDYFFWDKKNKFAPEKITTVLRKKNVSAALKFAKKLNYPVFIKPNSSAQGQGCFLANNQKELEKKLKIAFDYDHLVLVQQYLTGPELRLVVLNSKVIACYQKTKPYLTADGQNSLKFLIKKQFTDKLKQQRIKDYLDSKKINLKTVLPKNQILILADVANLSAGGMIIKEIEIVPPILKNLGKKLSRMTDLKFLAADLIVTKNNFYVLEINSNPSFKEYYGFNRKNCTQIYLKLLKASFSK